jgi:3-hydroxyacyl-CoA dehydrogenase
MFYADSAGLKNVLARIEEFRNQHGDDLWSPAPLLRRLAESGGTFAEYDKEKQAAAGV